MIWGSLTWLSSATGPSERRIFISRVVRMIASIWSCLLCLGPLKTLAKPPPSALSSCIELPVTIAPTAAPPMISISCGIACMTGPSAPPVNAKPPNTITSRMTTPMTANMV